MLDLKWHVSKSFKTTAFRFRSIVLPKILLTIDLRITNTRTSIHIIQKIRMKCVKKTIEHWILLTIAKLSNKKNVYSCSTNICFVCRIVELSNGRMEHIGMESSCRVPETYTAILFTWTWPWKSNVIFDIDTAWRILPFALSKFI